jgi:chemotaxis signal transduction protein
LSQGTPVILFTIGDTTFAIAAAAVSEIQGLQEMKQFTSIGKVRSTLEREGRRYWVVDANLHFHMPPTNSTRVLLLRESPVAVKVDGIERMTEMAKLLPLPNAFRGDERHWYLGLALLAGKVIPVVNPAGFLSHFELNALEMSAPVVTRVDATGAIA